MSRLLFQPRAGDALKAGIDTLAEAVTPTLGPLTGAVALDDANRRGSPELLDDGGAIARRILQLPDRDEDVGAMLLRERLWRQKQRYGDGAATAAALFQAVYAAGHRYIRAGGDAMLLRRHLESGMRLMLARCQELAQPLANSEEIERLALSVSGQREIAAALADTFDVLGAHSPIEIQDGARELRHEFFLGSHWECQVPSNIVFQAQAGSRIELRNTAWLISDFELDDLSALVTLVTDVYKAGFESLAILAKSFSEQIIAAQAANSQMPDFTLVFIQPTGLVDEQEAALADLALLTGGRTLREITNHSLSSVDMAALGKSELAWLDRNRFGLIAAGGDEATVQREIATLQDYYQASEDERRREVLSARMGRLQGGSAVIYCHGSSESEMRHNKDLLTRTLAAVRTALLEGALPGGGTALLRCIEPLRQAQDKSQDENESAAMQILITAASVPSMRLLRHAGHEAPSLVVDEVLSRCNGAGFDLRRGILDDMRGDGALDSAAAVLGAIRSGIGGAALALTIDAIVHRVNPPLAIEPGGMPASANMGNIELK